MEKNAAVEKPFPKSVDLRSAFEVIDTIGVSIIGLTPEGEIVYANPSACDLLECGPSDLLDHNIQAIAPEMTTKEWSCLWTEVDQKGFCESKKNLMLRVPKHEKVHINFRVLRIQGGEKRGCVIFLTKSGILPTAIIDVKSNREHLVRLLEAMSNPVVSTDSQLKFTFMNQAACRLFDTTATECIGKTVYDFFPPKYADIIWDKMKAVQNSGRPETYAADSFLSEKYGPQISLLPYFDPSTSQKRLLVVMGTPPQPPIPERKPEDAGMLPGMEKTRKMAELRRYMDEGAIGIYLKDTENRLVWMNQSYAAMLGFKPEELIGKRLEEIINDPDLTAELRREDETIYATGRPLFNLIKQPRCDELKFIRIDKIPFIDKKKNISGIIGLAVVVDPPPPMVQDLQQKLAATSRRLEDTETALRIVLEQKEKSESADKRKLSERVKSLVLPYLENLKQTALQPDQIEFVNLIEENLKNIYDPQYAKLSSPEYKLSPTELKVAQLVRDGKTNKEIAKMLHLSKSTILTHRHHIRVKLGIRNKKVNPRSLLKS